MDGIGLFDAMYSARALRRFKPRRYCRLVIR